LNNSLPSHTSLEWQLLKAHIEERLSSYARELELLTDSSQIYRVQGKIAALRSLIKDVEPRPAPPENSGSGPSLY
jgi:hypothetical protein